MNNSNKSYSNPKQAVLPMLIQDYLDICDPVLTFDRFMGGIELENYLKSIPKHYTGRLRYDPVSMLKTVLFGFMMNGYISLRELEDQCKVNLRFMYLMEHETPSYRTFGYFINEVLGIPSKKSSMTSIGKSLRQNTWTFSICISTAPSSRPMRTSIHGCEKKQRKDPGTACLIRSQLSSEKSMKNWFIQA